MLRRSEPRRGSSRGIAALMLGVGLLLITADAFALRSGPRRTRAVEMVVIHSTGGPTCDPQTGQLVWIGAGTLAEDLRNIEAHPQLGVHYMIDRDGTVRSSVPEDRVAHHVFHFSEQSIGIELVNDGDGRDPFPEPQLEALVKLLRGIVQRRGIPRTGIRRHSDLDHGHLACAPTQLRKVDPGAAFPLAKVINSVFGAR